jgi:hypothetical protein
MKKAIRFLTPTEYWVGGGIIFLNNWICMGSMLSENEKHTAEPLAPEPIVFEVEMPIEKIIRHN